MFQRGGAPGGESVVGIQARGGKHQWASIAGAIDSTGWSNLTTFGSRTWTQGGALAPPDWAVSIDGLINADAADGSAAAGGITGRKFATGIGGLGPQYLLCEVVAEQTTSGESALARPQYMNPMMQVKGNIQLQATPGATDLGVADAQTSIRFSDQPFGAAMQWLAAEVTETDATDLLAVAMTSLGGDLLFPYRVTDQVAGIRAAGFAQTSNFGAAGDSVGQALLEGSALVCDPPGHQIGGGPDGGEAAATSIDFTVFPFWDDSLALKPGQMDWLVGYTGDDLGTQTSGGLLGLQLTGLQ